MLNSALRFIQKLWVLTFVGMAFYAGKPAMAASAPGDVVGKVSVGYQGWFGAAGDGSPQNNWWHWSQNWNQIFSPSNNGESNSWPDVRDYTKTYQTGFAKLGNGQPATVFSSYDQQTVNAQVSWMQQNGIDTIALQRFNPAGEPNRDGMAARVRTAAETYGRKFYIMYDITGWQTADTDLKTDWTNKMSAYTSSPAYARQNGKPVVCVWLATSTLSVSQLLDIVNWLKSQGLYVIVGVERAWRTDTAKLPVYNAANMISPWLIGSVGSISDADNVYNTYMVPDEAYCNAHGLDYQPVVLPGDLHLHQRHHGNLMWEMFYNAVRLPAQGIYISMYDEYGEGNQIMKTADTQAMVPAGAGYPSLDEDGTYCTSDYYLRLAGAGDRMFKGLMPLSVARPSYPGGAQRLALGAVVALKAVVNGEYVCGGSSPLIANCTADDQQDSFQVVDAGNGNIALLSLANNEYVTAENAGASSLIADQTAVGSWQTFTEVDAENGNIGLLATANGKYVSAGASPLIANSTSVGSSQSFTVVAGTAASPEGPFGGTPAAIPGTVKAENYDTGGQGVGYNVTSVNGTNNGYRSDGVDLEVTMAPGGGNNLGWTAAGQWFRYTVNVATAGKYAVTFEVSSPNGVTDGFHLSNSSGTNLTGAVNVPATGAWQTWTTVTANATLPAGTQTLTLNQDNAGWNIDSMAFALTTSGGGTCTSICIDSGSTAAVSPFVADVDFSGGSTINHANTINTSKVTNPAPAAVYQSARIATTTTNGVTSFTYTVPGFTAGSSHTVRLHFCETFFTTKSSRTFNVSINGTQVLTNFDIVAASGGINTANIQQFTAAANSSGQYVLTFTSVTNNALISGIEID
jgi:Carbohydrate binding module (family 6)/Malectin domain